MTPTLPHGGVGILEGKKMSKKPFVIEWRIKKDGWPEIWHDWKVWKRYKTRKSRDEALKVLSQKDNKLFEYRARED